MGGVPSTRRVTVVNDNNAAVIRISESVARKLQGDENKSSQSSLPPTPSQQQIVAATGQNIAGETPFYDHSNYFIGACDTVMLRQKHDTEIKKMQETWKSHINKLEEQNEELFKKANEKFSNDLNELEAKYLKKRFEPVCQEAERKVLDCYQQNKSQPLKCASVVRDFTDCVRKVRREILSRSD